MIMRKLSVLLIILLVMVLFTSACTKKKNLTGDNWSDIRPITTVDTSFVMGYSYLSDGEVTGTETSLITGSDNGISAYAVMRFTSLPLPDSTNIITQPILKLTALRRSLLGRAPLQISFYKLNQNWAVDSTSSINDNNISPVSFATHAVLQDTIYAIDDTLNIPIPISAIEDWQTTGVTGFNVVVKPTNGGWLQFKSYESGEGPLLNFKYQKTGATDTLEYNQRCIDSYKVSGTQSNLLANTWKLKNLRPQRMFFRFNLPDAIFKDQDNEQMDALDIKRMTVNKAELVLFVKDNPYYTNTTCSFFPYHVTIDTLTAPTVLTESNIESLPRTYATGTIVNRDSVRIDITPIIQAYTSGDKPKNGIVVKSTKEMLDFGSVEFWNFNDTGIPAGKKPKVRITYTTPYLKG